MSSANLLTPVMDTSTRSVNFFNGRLLTAEDLSREQDANREAKRLLGQAIGEGVAYGLEVSKAAGAGLDARVTVQPGLAINRNGGLIRLPAAVDLSLVRPQNGGAAPSSTGFSECQPFQAGVYVTGSGVYLLTARPARGLEGKAPASGLQSGSADCNAKYLVDGVQFRLVQLDFTAAELGDTDRLRNLVAYKCFGIEASRAFATDPFGVKAEGSTLLDNLRPTRFTDCEVPLAVLHWTATAGISFIDMWSVRRRLSPRASTGGWLSQFDDRRLSEAEAMFLQFQDQIEAMRLPGNQPEFVVATDYFRYLPPAGFLPLTGIKGSRGMDYLRFFGGLKWNPPFFMEGVKLESLIRSSFSYPPIDSSTKKLIWLYWVRENIQTINTNTSNSPQAYLVFANGYIPYQGDARFDLSHGNYSNFS